MIRRSKHGFSHLLDAISAPRLKCFRVSGSRGSTFGRFGGTELGRNRSGRSLRSITRSSCHLEIASGKNATTKSGKTSRNWNAVVFFCNDDVSRLQDELPEPEPHECRATSQLVCWVHVFENSLKNMFFWALQALKIYKSIKILSFFHKTCVHFDAFLWCQTGIVLHWIAWSWLVVLVRSSAVDWKRAAHSLRRLRTCPRRQGALRIQLVYCISGYSLLKDAEAKTKWRHQQSYLN